MERKWKIESRPGLYAYVFNTCKHNDADLKWETNLLGHPSFALISMHDMGRSGQACHGRSNRLLLKLEGMLNAS